MSEQAPLCVCAEGLVFYFFTVEITWVEMSSSFCTTTGRSKSPLTRRELLDVCGHNSLLSRLLQARCQIPVGSFLTGHNDGPEIPIPAGIYCIGHVLLLSLKSAKWLIPERWVSG